MATEKIGQGIVIGKFLPFHNGHLYVIETAMHYCHVVSIIICSSKMYFIDPQKIKEAIILTLESRGFEKKSFNIEIVEDIDEGLSSVSPKRQSKAWAKYVSEKFDYDPNNTAVFGSDDYVGRFSKELGFSLPAFIVDKERNKFDISGTLCRRNILDSRHKMSPHMFLKIPRKICFVGAESTGKTSLVKKYAKMFNAFSTTEYGRIFCEHIDRDKETENPTWKWSLEWFHHIIDVQNRMELPLLRDYDSNIQFSDTDAISTVLWAKRYYCLTFNEAVNLLMKFSFREWTPAFCYIIINPELVKFEQDGTRHSENLRNEMHLDFIQLMRDLNLSYVCIDTKEQLEGLDDIVKGLVSYE